MKIKVRKINPKNTAILASAKLDVGGIPVICTIIESPAHLPGEVVVHARAGSDLLLRIMNKEAENLLAAAALHDMGLSAPPDGATIYLAV